MSSRAKKHVKWFVLLGVVLGGTLIAGLLLLTPGMDILENATWSWRVQTCARPSAISPKIKLILLDQASINWGQEQYKLDWPWPRQVYAPLIQFCKRAGARMLALDVLFTEPSLYGVFDDEAFGESLSDSGITLGSLYLGQSGIDDPAIIQQLLPRLNIGAHVQPDALKRLEQDKVLLPIQDVATNVVMLGNVAALPDDDGAFRSVALFGHVDGHWIPSLSFAAYLFVQNEQHKTMTWSHRRLTIGSASLPLDPDSEMLLRYPPSMAAYTPYSAAAVIQSEQNLQAGLKPVIDPSELKDCYVFFGFSAPALMDLRSTPVSESTPGVFIHAVTMDNLLSMNPMNKLNYIEAVLYTMLWLLLFTAMLLWSSRFVVSIVSLLLLAVFAVAATFAGYLAGYWLPLVVPLLICLVCSCITLLINYLLEGRQKAYIKQAFRFYLSPALIEQLLADPERLKLGGERKELSIFFSDLQSFSSFSERLEPQELTHVLNDYLSDMTDIILDEGGTLDKYEGDAIICFWNAPIDQPDHALRCCRAALRCQQKLAERRDEFMQRWGVELRMRIGIHTGEVVVGNMGSSTRFDYTMLGDAANLASRLEGANKAFKTYTMISRATMDKLPDHTIPTRPLGRLRVVGRKSAVEIFEIITPESALQKVPMIGTFCEGLQCISSNDWKNAAEKFQSLENDPVSQKYLNIAQEHLTSSTPWDGIWNMTEK